MKYILSLILVLCFVVSKSQVLQEPNIYGYKFKRSGSDTLHFIPSDTLRIPTQYNGLSWIAKKGTSLYYWNGARWSSFSSSFDTTSIYAAINGKADSLRRSGLSVQMRKNGSWTTQFNLPDSAGGSSDSSWAKIVVGDKKQIGTRYEYSWATNPLGTNINDATPTVTVTTDGSKTILSGGSLNLNNYLTFNDADYISTHNWEITQSFVTVDKSTTSYGLAIALNQAAFGQAAYAHFLLSDTTGFIVYSAGAVIPSTSYQNNKDKLTFKWAAGDTIDVSVKRRNRWLYMEMRNRSNGMVSRLVNDFVHISSVKPSIQIYGSTIHLIGSFKITYQDVVNPKIAFIGTSITYYATSFDESTTWVNQGTAGITGGVVNMAGSSERSIDGTYKMYDILKYVKPDYLVVDYAVNDRNSSTNVDSFSARLSRIVTQAQDSGIVVFMCTGTPLYGGSMTQYNDTVIAVASRYGCELIDNYTALVGTGTDIDSKYLTDGVHFNQLGNDVLGGVLKSKLEKFIPYDVPVATIYTPKVNTRPYYIASFDENYQLTRTLAGKDSSYIRTLPDGATSSNSQPGGLHLTKPSAIQSEVRLGGTYASPYLHINHPSYSVWAVGFKSKGFETNSGGMWLGDDTNPNVFIYDFRSYQRSHKITFNYPTSAGVGLILNTANEDGILGSSYKFQEFRDGNTAKSFIDKNGVLRYVNFTSDKYTDSSVVTKKYVDSLLGTVGGGDMSIYVKQQDTITIASFTAGSGIEADTASFSTTSIYGSFYNDGSDTLIITKLIAVMNGGTSDTLGVQIYFNDSINVIGSTVATSTLACNSTTTGNSTTTLTSYKIPPGNWVWCKTPVVVAGRKPYYLSVSLIGYKKRI